MASGSELTEQNYRALQELHRELGTSHFNVLAFPCSQYGDTESGTSREIEAFAKSNYGVTFPIFSKIKIMGSEAEPAFRFITGRFYLRIFIQELFAKKINTFKKMNAMRTMYNHTSLKPQPYIFFKYKVVLFFRARKATPRGRHHFDILCSAVATPAKKPFHS